MSEVIYPIAAAFRIFSFPSDHGAEIGEIVALGADDRITRCAPWDAPYGVIIAVEGLDVVVQRRGLCRIKTYVEHAVESKRPWWRRIFS